MLKAELGEVIDYISSPFKLGAQKTNGQNSDSRVHMLRFSPLNTWSNSPKKKTLVHSFQVLSSSYLVNVNIFSCSLENNASFPNSQLPILQVFAAK